MFSFKMPSGAGGSPMSMMSNQQKLQALGSAFSGDQQGLSSILAQLQGGQGGGAPVVSQGGQDISAAFGGDFAMASPATATPLRMREMRPGAMAAGRRAA
jgi:hypothetical protein